MKATIEIRKGFVVELEAEKQRELFKLLASLCEVFGERTCGLCQSANIHPAWRSASRRAGKVLETFEFAEWRCRDCGARLSMGVLNDDSGTLYPQRRLVGGDHPPSKEERERGEGEYGPHRGWHKFTRGNGGD